MQFKFKKVVALTLAGVITLQTAGCGYFLYPERRGQTSGRIDPAVAIMDGLGLLLFVIPGLIAFAVDFSTGAIYLPGTGRRSDLTDGDIKRIQLRGTITPERLSELLAAETGREVDLSKADVHEAEGAAPEMLVQILNSGIKDRPAFN